MNDSIAADIVLITPEQARVWLATGFVNRNINKDTVRAYVRDMRSGNWKLNGETIKISERGQLIDGQHRLTALVQHGQPVAMLVVFGVADDAVDTVDRGKKRSLADVLSMAGEVNTSALASAIGLLIQYENGTPIGHQPIPTIAESVAYLEKNRIVNEATHYAMKKSRRRAHLRPSVVISVFVLARRVASDGVVDDFFSGVMEGVGLLKDDARLTLRTALMNHLLTCAKHPVEEHFAFFIKAWNAYSRGKPIASLKWARNETFPEMIGAPRRNPWDA